MFVFPVWIKRLLGLYRNLVLVDACEWTEALTLLRFFLLFFFSGRWSSGGGGPLVTILVWKVCVLFVSKCFIYQKVFRDGAVGVLRKTYWSFKRVNSFQIIVIDLSNNFIINFAGVLILLDSCVETLRGVVLRKVVMTLVHSFINYFTLKRLENTP